MQKELFIALFTGLGGMLGWGFADFFAKKTIDKIGSIGSLLWGHLFGTFLLILIAIFNLILFGNVIHIPSSPGLWIGLVFFGVLQMIVYLLVYEGFGKGQLAVLNPLFASFTGLVAFISIVIFKEQTSNFRALALIVIFVGVMVMSMDIQALRSRRIKFGHVPGFREVLLATVLAAVWTLGWDRFIGNQDSLSFTLFMYMFMTIATFIFSKLQRVKLPRVKSELWKFLILIGLGEVIAYSAISFGYSTTSFTSVVALISGAFSVPTIILARIFLKEKVTPAQTFGSIIIILGIMILSL